MGTGLLYCYSPDLRLGHTALFLLHTVVSLLMSQSSSLYSRAIKDIHASQYVLLLCDITHSKLRHCKPPSSCALVSFATMQHTKPQWALSAIPSCLWLDRCHQCSSGLIC